MKLSEHRRLFARELVTFLETTFTENLGDLSQWWQSHVLNELSYGQRGQVRSRGIERLGQLDLQSLLRIFDRNWGELSHWCRLSTEVRTLGRSVADQRNRFSHEAVEESEIDPSDQYRDFDTLFRFSSQIGLEGDFITELGKARSKALAELTSAQLPDLSPAQPEVTNIPVPATTEPPEPPPGGPVVDPEPVETSSEDDPDARVLGDFRLHGPGESMVTEIASFKGDPVPATEIPWRVTGPGGLELKVHICLIDDPDEGDEIGQVFCDSRVGSPEKWDEIVRRLRIGIRVLEDGRLSTDLRVAQAKENARASRRVIPLDELTGVCGFDIVSGLARFGDARIGTREELIGITNKTRDWPCVVFDQDDILTPVAAWVAVTVAPLFN